MAEYIEREELLAWFGDYKANDPHEYLSPQQIIDDIAEIPSADVAPAVHAKWIDGADSFGAKPRQFRVCSRCNICFPRDDRIVPPAYWQGCPNCLARMDGE